MRLRFFETVEKKIMETRSTNSGEQLENSRRAHSASHAHRYHAVAALAPLQIADDRGGKFCAGASQWMAQRDRATAWIQTCRIQTRLLNYGQRLRGESFIQFDHVDVRQKQTRKLQRFWNGEDRPEAKFLWRASSSRVGYEASQWF